MARVTRNPSVWLSVACLAVLGAELAAIARNLPVLRRADFMVFWTASAAIHAGAVEQIASPTAFRALQETFTGLELDALFPWLYPPPALLLVWPLAFLPYGVAFVVWVVTTAAAYLAALRRAFPSSRVILLAGLASPAAFMTVANGQTSFLAAALLAWGLLLLPDRPWLAGALLGALVVKPQLALCVPIALLAGRHRAALASSALTAAAISVASAAAFGIGVWTAFRTIQAPFAWQLMEDGRIGYHKVQSAFAAVRLAGGSMGLAAVVQGVVAACVVLTLAWVWSRREVDHELKVAALLSGGPLTSVYLLDYDMVATTVAVALVLARALRVGWMRGEMIVLAVAAVVPGLSRLFGAATSVNPGPVALLALYAVVLVRATRELTSAPVGPTASFARERAAQETNVT